MTEGYSDLNVYVCNPMDFMRHEHDPARLDAFRRPDIVFAIGKDDPSYGNNVEFSGILWGKGIGNALREWDGWAHDWPYWERMIRLYIGGHDWGEGESERRGGPRGLPSRYSLAPTSRGGVSRMPVKVGLIVGREWSFPPAFIEEVNRRDEGVVAEFVKLGAPRMDDPAGYRVIIDRISHEVPFYRTYLKHAALQGAVVINNPFMWSADDKFFGATLATSLGLASPKTVVLPNKDYIPGIVHTESLRNLEFPLDWNAVLDYVGLPCVLKDAHGGGWKEVYVCRTMEELLHHYDHSGLLTMIVQEFIEWEEFVRCLCLGQDEIYPMKYDPKDRKYHPELDFLPPRVMERGVDDSSALGSAGGG